MNKQKPPRAIEWTRIRNADGTVRDGFTWNPVGGCEHECRWEMPNGEIAICYAEEVAHKLAQHAYPHGFNHHYWNPEKLKEPGNVKKGAGIFLDSMSDLMGKRVPADQVEQVLQVCRDNPQHIFQLLTKNAPRLLKFEFPPNVWVGASMPPDFYMGSRLNRYQQCRMLLKTLDVLGSIGRSKGNITWVSFEPLSWDVSPIVQARDNAIDWAVIGAASNGREIYPPDEAVARALVEELDMQGVPVFFKGNMVDLPWAAANWREEFPL